MSFNTVKVFSSTMYRDREVLGETITAWIKSKSEIEIVDIVVRQSSDDGFHCLSIIVFFNESNESISNASNTSARRLYK